MAEKRLRLLDRVSPVDRHTAFRVPQIVKADVRQTVLFQELCKALTHGILIDSRGNRCERGAVHPRQNISASYYTDTLHWGFTLNAGKCIIKLTSREKGENAMFGRRPDGRRIKGIDPVMRITPYIMPMRCDAQVFLKYCADMETLSRYIRRQKTEKNEQISYMQIIVAAYVRAVSQNPEVNRFIMNKQLYARNNCSAAFTILKDPGDADKGEAVVKIKFDLTDTLYDVRDRMTAAVAANRGDQPAGFVDKLLAFLFAVPGLATMLVGLVRFLDRYGLAPGVLMEELPFYVGMYITNTASIGLHDVNHHIYNWGNVGLFLSMGVTEKIAVVENGEARMKRCLPIGITADERVCSGAHYARFFSNVKRYLEHPELLESPPETVRFDRDCEYHEPKLAV